MSATSSWQYQKARRAFKAKCQAVLAPCARCGGAIDYSAPPQTEHAFELGHIHPRSTHPWLFYDEANWQPEHSKCNRVASHKARTKPAPPAPTTGKWVRADWK